MLIVLSTTSNGISLFKYNCSLIVIKKINRINACPILGYQLCWQCLLLVVERLSSDRGRQAMDDMSNLLWNMLQIQQTSWLVACSISTICYEIMKIFLQLTPADCMQRYHLIMLNANHIKRRTNLIKLVRHNFTVAGELQESSERQMR